MGRLLQYFPVRSSGPAEHQHRQFADARANWILWVVPILLLGIGYDYAMRMFPLYPGLTQFNADTPYLHLFNGANILERGGANEIAHSAGAFDTLVALCVGSIWFMHGWHLPAPGEIALSVAQDPEAYVRGVCTIWLLMMAISALYLGRRVFVASGNRFMALLVQLAPLMYPAISPRISYLAPDLLLMCVSMLAMGLLTPAIFRDHALRHAGGALPAVMAGALCGLGLSAGLQSLPIFGLLFIEARRRYAAWSFLAAALSLLCGFAHLRERHQSLANLSEHLYRLYASRANDLAHVSGFMSVVGASADLGAAFSFALVVVAMAICLGLWNVLPIDARHRHAMELPPSEVLPMSDGPAAFGRGRSEGSLSFPNSRAAICLELVCLLQIALAASSSNIRNFIPAVPVASVLCALIFSSPAVLQVSRRMRHWLSVTVLGVAVLLAGTAVAATTRELSKDAVSRNEIAQRQRDFEALHPDAMLVGVSGCLLRQCALAAAANRSSGGIQRLIAAAIPNFIVFNIWNEKLLVLSEGFVDLDKIGSYLKPGQEVFVVSPDHPQLGDFDLEVVDRIGAQTTYRFLGLRHASR